MANNQDKGQQNGGSPRDGAGNAPQFRTLTASEVGEHVLNIVRTLEPLAEPSQRRILESVRVQLGLMPQREATQQRGAQNSGGNGQRRGS